MEKSLVALKRLENILRKLAIQVCTKGITRQNIEHTLYATLGIIRIFNFGESKEAERVLRDLLKHWNHGIKFLAFYALLDAKNKGNILHWQTEIDLEKFKNNPLPINQEIRYKANAMLKAEKAPFN